MSSAEFAENTVPVKTDVCMQAFGKPLQTALALLTLHQFSGAFINKMFFVIEPAAPKYDNRSLNGLNGIVPSMHSFTPAIWNGLDELDPDRLKDEKYRHSIRYQYGWETSDADFLLLLHNDVVFKDDIVTPFINNIGANVGIGAIGQCWNCPAHNRAVTRRTNINKGNPCKPENYDNCSCSFDQLKEAYRISHLLKLPLRWKAEDALQREYEKRPWPLPECRLNEWCGMINLGKARKLTVPYGTGRPFGAYLPGHDLGVAWFRDMNHAGLRFAHMDIKPYVEHNPGHKALFDEKLYFERENQAARLIKTMYPEKVEFLRERGFL